MNEEQENCSCKLACKHIKRMGREGMPKAPGMRLHPLCRRGCSDGLSVGCGALQMVQLEKAAGLWQSGRAHRYPQSGSMSSLAALGAARGGRGPCAGACPAPRATV